VRSAAQLEADVAHLHHSDFIAVFLAEQCDGALPLGFLKGNDFGLDWYVFPYSLVHERLDAPDLSLIGRGEVGIIEAEPPRCDERAGLIHMFAKHLLERALQQVSGRVVRSRVAPAVLAYAGRYFLAHPKLALLEADSVHGQSAHGLFCVEYMSLKPFGL